MTDKAAEPPAWTLVAILLVGLGVLARVLASFGELWFDELWTLYATRGLGSASEVFTTYRSSNNHHLYSLYYYALGDGASWFVYRLPSLVTGTLTLPLVWLIARPAGRLGAAVATTLTATSYVMIHFASEARGYSCVVFFAVATLYTARRYLEGYRWTWAVLFWLCPSLGFLSHIMYSLAFAGVCVWLPVQLLARERRVQTALLRSLQVLGVPMLFFVWFYFQVIRQLDVGAGPPFTWPAILTKTLSYAGGGPASGPVAVLVALLTAAVVAYAVLRMRKEGGHEWLFFVTTVFVAPILTLLATQPEVMFVRYFVISIALGYIAVGYWAADLFRQGRTTLVAVAMVLFVIGNGVNVANLLRYGRGAYLEGVRFMAANTAGDVVAYASDSRDRNGIVIDYYKRFLTSKNKKRFGEVPGYPETNRRPPWLVLHHIGESTTFRQSFRDRFGNTYVLQKHLPYSDMSGWHWLLYRLKGPEGPR